MIRYFIILLACFVGSECYGQTPFYRYSADYSLIVVYLSTNVAFSKGTVVEPLGHVKAYFSIWKGHWQGEPELAALTGDIRDSDIEDSPTKAGISDDRKWLLVQGNDYDEKHKGFVDSFHLVSLYTGNVVEGKSLQDIQIQMGKSIDISAIKMDVVEIFFDKMLIRSKLAKNDLK